MKRAPVNPWSWSLQVGYHQAEILEGSRRQLVCAGQTAFDADGAPRHPGDMRRQMALAPDNLEAVLKGADMGLADITCLRVYATDVDEALKHFDVLGERFGPLAASPPMTLLGVTRPEDAPEMEDRYFDKSHRVKELKAVFGVSPGQLKGAQHPILQLSLEVRQQRRLDALELLAPDAKRPWRDPDSEPRDGSFDQGTDR